MRFSRVAEDVDPYGDGRILTEKIFHSAVSMRFSRVAEDVDPYGGMGNFAVKYFIRRFR